VECHHSVTHPENSERAKSLLLAPLLLVVVATLPYLATLDGELVWDDRKLIAEDHRFHEPNPVSALLSSDFFGRSEQPFRYGYLRPLTSLSYLGTWSLFGANPLPYRLTNLALHVMATVLVWVVARRLFPRDALGAFLGGALFAVHPVHAESVAWISGRTDLFCTVLVLPVVALTDMIRGARPRAAVAVTACFFCGLGLWAKEMAAAVPAALIAFAPLVQPAAARTRWMLLSVGTVLAALPYIGHRVLVSDVGVHGLAWDTARIPMMLWTFFSTFSAYVGELFLPLGARPYIQNPWRNSFTDLPVLIGAVLLLVVADAVWQWRQRRPALAWLGVFFVVSFLPISNVLRITGPVDMGAPMAQRFLYLPSVAWCVAGGIALSALRRLCTRASSKLLWGITALTLAVTFTFETAFAARTWATEELLFNRIVSDAPDAPLPRMLLGSWHRRHGRPAEAVTELEVALGLLPPAEIASPWGIYNELAGAWLKLGRCDKAFENLAMAGGKNSPFASIHGNLGLYHRLCGEAADAEAAFDRALKLAPWHDEARFLRALLYLETGRSQMASEELALLITRHFDHPLLVPVKADAAVFSGRADQARTILETALKQNPNDVELLLRLAALVPSELAQRLLDRAAELAPDDIRINTMRRNLADGLPSQSPISSPIGRQ